MKRAEYNNIKKLLTIKRARRTELKGLNNRLI